jgi:DNA topoisomerase-1
VKYGSKYASLKEDDPYTVTLERAREVIRLKKEADAQRIIQDFVAEGIQVLHGRYGPYITDKKKNAKIPKDRDPKTLTLEECRTLLAAAPERGARFGRWGRGKRAAATPVAAGDGAPAATTKAAGRAGARKKAAKSATVASTHAATAATRSAARAGARARNAAKSGAAAKPGAPGSHVRAKTAHAGRKPRAAKASARKRPGGKARAKATGTAAGRVRGVK